jgi:hypothetical protein
MPVPSPDVDTSVICRGLFVFSEKWEMIFRFVDIGGMAYHHYLNFFYYKHTMYIPHILASTHKDHMLSQIEWQHKHEQHNSQ